MTGLEALNGLSDESAGRALGRCCGSKRWIAAMLAERPFKTWDQLYAAAERIWAGLSREDWLEAFSHHPRIGDAKTLKRAKGTSEWAKNEQAGAMSADDGVKEALAELNQTYEQKFGHVYLVCATGKTGSELLTILRARMDNDPEAELRVAAAEQAKITRLRLEKLLT